MDIAALATHLLPGWRLTVILMLVGCAPECETPRSEATKQTAESPLGSHHCSVAAGVHCDVTQTTACSRNAAWID